MDVPEIAIARQQEQISFINTQLEDIKETNNKILAGVNKIENINTIITQIKEDIKELDDRIKEDIKELDDKIEEDIKELDDRIEEIEKKPANNWDRFIWLVFGVVISVVITLIASQVGL